tara:strand:+ start:635 stop:1237 length:603 start_codon:yes stop_codon:yes gene_type:complete
MSGQFPTSPVAQDASIGSQQNTLVSVTTSGRVQTRQIDGQKFTLTLDYAPMSRANFAPIKAFIMKQRSRLNTFTIIPPVVSNAQGSVTGTISVDGAISAGATTCTIDGLANSTNGLLKAGDYFRFSSAIKVYMAVADLNSNGSGEGTLTFEPPLRTAIPDNTSIVYDNVDFTVRITNDIQEYSIVTNDLYKYQIDLIENL